MKRVTAAVAAIGLVATGALVSVSGPASAAPPANPANLKVTPPPATGFDSTGARKAIVTWDDWTTTDNGFDEYRVVADRDGTFVDDDPLNLDYGPCTNCITATVAKGATREVLLKGLLAGKDYHVAVYAIDNTADGPVVIEPSGTRENTPIGYMLAPGFNLPVVASKAPVVRGNSVELSGTLTDAKKSPLANRTITIYRDAYPFDAAESATKTSEVTTNAKGRWTFSTKPQFKTRYWARFVPANGIGGWTKFVAVDVRAKISLNVSPDTTIKAGRTLTFRGKVNALPGKVAGLPICWQNTADGSWGGGSCSTIKDDGTYVFRLRPGKDADGKYRVRSGLGEYYADSKSKPVKITIR